MRAFNGRRFLTGRRRLLYCWAIGCVGVIVGSTAVRAKTIKLTDQTEVTADVLQTDDDNVIMRIPRDRIASVDGQPLPPVLGVGAAAPSFHVKDLAGADQAVGPKSDHVTLLHFWVHWCPHCRSDQPQIQALYDKFRDNKKVRILTVNLDEARQQVDQFIQEHHVTYPVIFAKETAAHGTDLPTLYQVQGFPITYLVDAQGIIRKKITGSFVESKQEMEPIIEELLPKAHPRRSWFHRHDGA